VTHSESQVLEQPNVFTHDFLADEDSAWASIKVPFTASQCIELFRCDIERLFRINPLYEVDEWESHDIDHCRLTGRNLSNDRAIDTNLTISDTERGFVIEYSSGLKASTIFNAEDIPEGAKLTLTDHYHAISPGKHQEELGEVDKSLIPWAKYLQEYLVRWRRWSWCGPWRWYMGRIWLPMKPSARRITYMILCISLAEIIAFLMIFTIFWFEMDKLF